MNNTFIAHIHNTQRYRLKVHLLFAHCTHTHVIIFMFTVDMVTGRPCIEFLDDYRQWNESYTLTKILTAIQVTLSKVTKTTGVKLLKNY